MHMGWANQKAQPKTKKQIMHIFKVLIPSQSICLPS